MPDQGPNPGSDGLSRAEVWKLLDTYNAQWQASHERMRNALDRNTQTMADGFEKAHQAFADHEEEDRRVERRVYDIEQREKVAAATVTKRNMAASGLVSVVVGPIMAWLLRKLFLL